MAGIDYSCGLGEMWLRADELREGDLVDLENDRYADPKGQSENHAAFECEYQPVRGVQVETLDCVRIDFDHDSVGFPLNHRLKIVRLKD